MFIIPMSFAQDYSFTIIDNSDFENCIKYRIKACHMYSFPDVKNAPNDSILENSYYYNESGMVILEINYIEPEDTAQKWILTAQYDGLTILSEQWKWENNDIDSTTFYYNEQGQLKRSCVKYYYEGKFDELECEDYEYKDGELINISHPQPPGSVVEKNDTIFHYSGDGLLAYAEVNERKVLAYLYDEDLRELIATYHYTYNADGEIEKTIRKDANGKITTEFVNIRKGTLIVAQTEYDVTTGVLSKTSYNYTYFE